ncbi:MAG TPA: TrkA family potassium uptake protein [Spirochaetes bacterium]|nr:TrkA family potassium uptake protein [Spirochaetota bacterium]
MKQFAVFGLGVFGISIAKNLMKEGMEVVVFDRDIKNIEAIKNDVTQAAVLDSSKEEALHAIDIGRVDCAIVAIGDDMESSILTALFLKKCEVPKIIARANTQAHRRILSLIGVDEILSPEEEMGMRLAKRLSSAHILHHIDISEEHTIAEVIIAERFIGKTLLEMNLRSKFGVNIVGIKKKIPDVTEDGENVFLEKYIDFPSPDDIFEANDVLVMVGTERAISDVEKFIERE